jgi:hypothetical protein
VSVGHVARTFEEEGLPNVIIMSEVFKDRTIAMNPPRVLLTRHPMGRPISAPGDRERQLEVLKAGLELLDSASEGGTVVTFDKPFRHGSSAQ